MQCSIRYDGRFYFIQLSENAMSNNDDDKKQKRERAERWVNGYTATAVAAVLAAAPIPGAATAIVCSLEVTMCYQIGIIYRGEVFTMTDATAVATLVGVASLMAKIVVMEAAIILGPFAFVAKPAVAATIVKAMGQLVIKHFEDRLHE